MFSKSDDGDKSSSQAFLAPSVIAITSDLLMGVPHDRMVDLETSPNDLDLQSVFKLEYTALWSVTDMKCQLKLSK